MSYIVTGFEPYKNGLYYILDTKTGNINKIFVDDIKKIPPHIFDIQNMRINTQKETGNILLSNKNTSKNIHSTNWELIRNNIILSGAPTLVAIDFNKNKFGTVSSLNRNVMWHDISLLENVINKDVYNNILIDRKTCKLELSNYVVLGTHRDIVLKKLLKDKEQANVEEERQLKEEVNRPVIEESITEEVAQAVNVSENKNEIDIEDSVNLYITILKTMCDNDVITIPRDIFKKLKFILHANIDKSMALDKRVSLGNIKVGDKPSDNITVIVQFDDSKDSIRVQLFKSTHVDHKKDYSTEHLTQEYLIWRQRNKYLKI